MNRLMRTAIRLAVTLPMVAVPATAAGADTVDSRPGWELRWRPDPARDGVLAFGALEDDRRGSHPEGSPHVRVDGNAYRFDAHLVDRDGSDRMRNEVRGMRTRDGRRLEIREGETWRLTYDMYVPDTLDATTRFSHIWQLKAPDVGRPLAQVSLPVVDGVPMLEARYWDDDNATHPVSRTPLEPLQNKWISVTIEFESADDGFLRFALRDGWRTVVDDRVDHVDLWASDGQWNRPKWGIYRNITSPGLQDTHLLIRDLAAWQRGPAAPPIELPPPDRGPGAYEAERAGNTFEGAAEAVYCDVCSGGQKVVLTGGNIYDFTVVKGVLSETSRSAPMTIHAVVDGEQSFFVSVNGADSVEVPMTGSRNVVSTATVDVPLVAGVNHIRFYSHRDRTPELDKVVIGEGRS